MSNKLLIPFEEKIDPEDLESGVMSFASWQRIKPLLASAYALKPNESIVGLIVTKEGIKVKIKTEVTTHPFK